MGKTITIRLTKAQQAWLEARAQATGRARGAIIRDEIEKARKTAGTRGFMRLAGVVSGPRDLSTRKGFSRG